MRIQGGFSIIELMTVILIGSILVLIAIPNYTAFVKNNCLTTYANKLVSSFAYARTEAVKQGVSVGVLINVNGSTDWNQGWVVTNQPDVSPPVPATSILRTESLSCSTTTITEATPLAKVEYDSRGFLSSAAATFNICDDRPGVNGRQVSVSTTGRPHTDTAFICP